MPNTRRNSRRNTRSNARRDPLKKKSGAGYLTDQQWFNPDVLPPSSSAIAPSSNPTGTEVRPVLLSTFNIKGGNRNRRNTRGRFVRKLRNTKTRKNM